MCNNNNKYKVRIVLFSALGFDITNLSNHFTPIYLTSHAQTNNFEKAINNNWYRQIRSKKQLCLYINCLNAYNIFDFVCDPEEREALEAKLYILECLQKELGEAWCPKSIWEYPDSPFCKSIIGTLYYYGINRTVDQKWGEELLIEAANMGDSDALLWCLWKHPEKAREYMEQLVSLPDSLANPEWLDPWKEHYNLWDVKEKQIVKHKIGF